MNPQSKIFVAEHSGVMGKAIYNRLKASGYKNLVVKTRKELDLTDQAGVRSFFDQEKPEMVFLATGTFGGVHANLNYPVKFIYENLMMSANVIQAAFAHDIRKLIYFGCSSMYPKGCAQPMVEEDLMSGRLEESSEAFAVAKLAGLTLCGAYNREYGTSYVTLVASNVYGEGLDYDPLNSIVIPSLISRFHLAKKKGDKKVQVWGSGGATRDFLHSGDLADAAIFVAENYLGGGVLNVGSGTETSIKDLATLIANVVGYQGEIIFDTSKPEGVARKLQSLDKIHKMGWRHKTQLRAGIELTYKDFLSSDKSN